MVLKRTGWISEVDLKKSWFAKQVLEISIGTVVLHRSRVSSVFVSFQWWRQYFDPV